MKQKTRKFFKFNQRRALIATALTLTFGQVLAQSSSHIGYSKADLEILQQSNAYEEFFKHAKDVRPVERDKSWREMLTDMATSFVDEKRENRDYKENTFTELKNLSQWPELQRDEFYQIKLNSYAIQYFQNCYLERSKQSCLSDIESYWPKANQTAELSYEILLLTTGFHPLNDNWNYVKRLTKDDVSSFYCHKEEVTRTIHQKIERDLPERDLPKTNLSDHKKMQTLWLQRLMPDNCWKKFAEGITLPMLSAPVDQFTNTFISLNEMNLLQDKDKDIFLTRAYLEGVAPGDVLNHSWSALNKLAQNYNLRKEVLEKLKSLDPLPGKVFALENTERRKILTKNLIENFPEYVRHYAQTCLDYRTGKKYFSRGNPTLHCDELFAVEKSLKFEDKIFSQELHVKYSGILKPKN